jgi:hypothetical protein
MPPADQEAWKRLGRLLADRRIEIGARYKNKNLFATERQINRRMLWQVESGERDTYRPDTLRAIEAAYMLAPGSLERTLAGGDLERAAAEPAVGRRPATGPLAAVPDGADEDAVIEMLIANEPDPGRRSVLERTWRFDGVDREDRLAMLRALLERGLPEDQGKRHRDMGGLTGP